LSCHCNIAHEKLQKMKKNTFLLRTSLVYMVLLIAVSPIVYAQSLFVGSGGVFYLSEGTTFTTSTKTIIVAQGGNFVLGEGASLPDGAGIAGTTTRYHTDGSSSSSITITTAADDNIQTSYTKAAPSGTIDPSLVNYALSDTEYWTVTQSTGSSTDVQVTGLTNTATTYGGKTTTGTPVLLRRDNTSSNWVKYEDNLGFGEFAYAAVVGGGLGLEEITWQDLEVYPNPAGSTQEIYYRLPLGIKKVDIGLYNSLGKRIYYKKDTEPKPGLNRFTKPVLPTGLYVLKFRSDERTNHTIKLLIH